MLGYTQTAATWGVSSVADGRSALRHNMRTLPGVSSPASVVRSIIEMAISRPASFAPFLMLRVLKRAARSSTPTWSTAGTRGVWYEFDILYRVVVVSDAGCRTAATLVQEDGTDKTGNVRRCLRDISL